MTTNLRNLPAVVYLPTRTMHAAYAAGGPPDGSLYGFYTLCHRRIGDEEVWYEVPERLRVGDPMPRRVHHCKQCQSIIDQPEPCPECHRKRGHDALCELGIAKDG
jgi:hypothetical protein